MSLLEIKADLLKTLMQEDRNEIRLIRERIINTISFITVSSFAVTSFLISSKNITSQQKLSLLTSLVDVAFLLLLWMIFLRLKEDLKNARRCLELREELIQDLPSSQADNFQMFLSTDNRKAPKILDNELYWLVSVASIAVIVKLVVIYIGF